MLRVPMGNNVYCEISHLICLGKIDSVAAGLMSRRDREVIRGKRVATYLLLAVAS